MSEYVSQAARDAERADYGGPAYWAYLDQSAREHAVYWASVGEVARAESMFTRSLAAALAGNDGE